MHNELYMDNQSQTNHTQQARPKKSILSAEDVRTTFIDFLGKELPTDQEKEVIIYILELKLSLIVQNELSLEEFENYPLVIDIFERISSLQTKTDTDYLLLMFCYQFQSHQTFLQKQYNQTIQHLTNYINCIDKLTDPSVQEQIDKSITLFNIGWLYDTLNDNEAAIALYQQGLEACLAINAVEDHSKRQKAELLYKLEEHLSKNLVVQQEQPLFHNTLVAYHAIGVTNVEDNYRVIDIYYQRGVFDTEQGRLTQALENFNQALEIYRVTGLNDIENNIKYYNLFYSLGIVASRLQDHESAIDFFQSALENITKYTGNSQDLSSFTVYIYNMLGTALIQAKRYDESQNIFDNANQLLSTISETRDDFNALRLLIDVNTGVVNAYRKKDWEALNKFKEAETLYQDMINHLPDDHSLSDDSHRLMLTLYLKQSQIYRRQKRTDESHTSLEHLKETYRQLRRPTPEDKFHLYQALQQYTLDLAELNDIQNAMIHFAQLTGIYASLDSKTEQRKRDFIQFCTRLNFQLRYFGHIEESKDALLVGIDAHKTLADPTALDQEVYLMMMDRLGRIYCAQADYAVGISHLKSAQEIGQQIPEPSDDIRRSILKNLKNLKIIHFELNLLQFAEQTIFQYLENLKLIQSPTESEQAQIYIYIAYQQLITEDYPSMFASFKEGIQYLSRSTEYPDDETCHAVYVHNFNLMIEVMQYAICRYQTSFKDYLPSLYLFLDFIGDMKYQLTPENYELLYLLMNDLTVIYYSGTINHNITKTMAQWFKETARLDLILITAQQLATNSLDDLNTDVLGILHRVLHILKNHQVNHPAADAIHLDEHSLEIINDVIETLRNHTKGVQSLQQKSTPLTLWYLSEENKALKTKIQEQDDDITSLKELVAQQGTAIQALQDQLASSSSNKEEQSVPSSPAFFK